MPITKILVEGPDCSGKTTLVERLKNKLLWDAKSLHHKEGNQFTRYQREYAFGEQIVFNRAHFSERVYSKLWRGGDPFSNQERDILNQLCTIDTLVILALPSLGIMQERYQKRNFPQQITYEELGECRELFCDEFKDVAHIFYASMDYNELENVIKNVYEAVILVKK